MNIQSQSIIGQLVAEDYRLASVFTRHGIDFCCNGQRSLQEACDTQQIDLSMLIQELQSAHLTEIDTQEDYDSWPLDELSDYIIDRHHHYVNRRIQEILPYLHKIVQVHGSQHPELIEVHRLFLETAGELSQHMKKEELILFPFIRKMTLAQNEGTPLPPTMFGSVNNPIAMMHHDHDAEGERFRQISALTQQYTPPADACSTYRTTFSLLREFEQDLHRHIHLENNILFPKAIELESALKSQ